MSASKKLFTPAEVEILSSNPYTLSVTSKTIRFTLAFKQAFWTKRLDMKSRVHRMGF